MSFTPTKEAIEAAARKAQDAYNLGRQVMERLEGLDAENASLRAEVSELRAEVQGLNAEVERMHVRMAATDTKPRRKAA
jgi:predicted RNase H-like nuclease (RuvC/YqgF family)